MELQKFFNASFLKQCLLEKKIKKNFKSNFTFL